MKRFSILTQVQALVITLIISACGTAQATPTVNMNDLQNTAVAAAFTLVAETEAAIPTATQPALPTATVMKLPDFTLTALVLPTSDVTASPTPTENPYAGDPCVNQVLPA